MDISLHSFNQMVNQVAYPQIGGFLTQIKVVGIPFLNTHLKEFFEYPAYLLSYTHFILSIIPLISL